MKNASSNGSQSAKFQLNLFLQTAVTAAFVRLPQNVKSPVLGNVCLVLTTSTACWEIPR